MINFLITGDDDGAVKVWDIRQQKEVFSWHDNEDFISELVIHPTRNHIVLAPSGDSSLSIYDIKKGKLSNRSDYVEDELLSIVILKNGERVVCGTQEGVLLIWKWGEWDVPNDKIKGHPQSIDAAVKIDEDTLCTGSSDGILRLVSVLPNKCIGPIGDHNNTFPIEVVKKSFDNNVLANTSHDHCVNFLNIAFLYEEGGDDDDDNNNDETKNNNNNIEEDNVMEGGSSTSTKQTTNTNNPNDDDEDESEEDDNNFFSDLNK